MRRTTTWRWLCRPSSRLLLSTEKQSLGDLATSRYFCHLSPPQRLCPAHKLPQDVRGCKRR